MVTAGADEAFSTAHPPAAAAVNVGRAPKCSPVPGSSEDCLLDDLADGFVHGLVDQVLNVRGQRFVGVERRPPEHEPGER